MIIIKEFLIGAFWGLVTVAVLMCIVGLIAGVAKLFKGLFKWCKQYWRGKFNYTDDEKDFFGK